MIKTMTCLFGAAFLLCGCSALDMFDAADPAPEPVAAVTAPMAESHGMPADWCQRIAADTVIQAQQSGFDAPTQQRMAVTALQQCTALSQN